MNQARFFTYKNTGCTYTSQRPSHLLPVPPPAPLSQGSLQARLFHLRIFSHVERDKMKGSFLFHFDAFNFLTGVR